MLSSSSLACPVIWGRRYSSYSFCPVCCVVFFIPGLSRHLGPPVQLNLILLHPWLVPSSGLSPVQLIILFLHSALFLVLSSFIPPFPCFSCCPLSAYVIYLFSPPSSSFPWYRVYVQRMSTSSILLTMCSSFILLTWPYHFSRFL